MTHPPDTRKGLELPACNWGLGWIELQVHQQYWQAQVAALSTKVERLGLSGGNRGSLRTLKKQEKQAPLETEKGQG